MSQGYTLRNLQSWDLEPGLGRAVLSTMTKPRVAVVSALPGLWCALSRVLASISCLGLQGVTLHPCTALMKNHFVSFSTEKPTLCNSAITELYQ